ncbi:S-layer homology domain-containing protein [Clostridiaceae bacterium OttesenSCG-928-D20]|nr:S-layer homology domain-containing protein [Clostridiaceae bacterium OttesenSCG-928-D20]
MLKKFALFTLIISLFISIPAAGLAYGSADDIIDESFPYLYIYDSRFEDVLAGQWFTPFVVEAFEKGLTSGVSKNLFDHGGKVTTIQAVTFISKIHMILNYQTDYFLPTDPWFNSILDYAIGEGIVTEEIREVLHKNITRGKFFQLMDTVLPEKVLQPVKPLPSGIIDPWTGLPEGLFNDLSAGSAYAPAVYKLYQAGIVSGDDLGNVNIKSELTRAEAATLLVKITNSQLRLQ